MASLTNEARELRAAYQREYRKKNPEKQKEYMRRYWEKKAAEAQAAETAGEKGVKEK